MIKKLSLMVRSRTVWTIIGLVLLNGLPSVKDLLPAGVLPYINLLLGGLAIYFRANVQAR